MADIKIPISGGGGGGGGGDEGERGKRGERGHRGHRGETGPAGPTIVLQDEGTPVPGAPHDTLNFIGAGVQVTDVGGGVADITIPGGPEFIPERTLFVAQSWPAGSDPTVFFTTIQAAITQAGTLTPTQANPVEVLVYPGTYGEPTPALLPHVHLVGTGQQRAVNITNGLSYVSVGNGVEQLNLAFFTLGAGLSIDTSGKTGGSFANVCRGIIYAGITFNGRAGNPDSQLIFASVLLAGTYTYTNAAPTILASRILPALVTFAGGTAGRIVGCDQTAALTLTGTATATIQGGLSTGVLTANAGTSIDVRGTNYRSEANLVSAGGGTINRVTHLQSSGAIGAVAVPFVLAVPFPAGTVFNVNLQLTSGAGDAGVQITAKTNAGFTITPSVAGPNTYDITLTAPGL